MAIKIKGLKKVNKTMFWILAEFGWSYGARTVTALLWGFTDEASLDAGENPITSQMFSWSGPNFDLFDITKAMDKQIKDLIMLNEDWIGAEQKDKDLAA